MTQVCRPTPHVRFMHMSEAWLKATHVSHGTRNIGKGIGRAIVLALEE